MARRLLSGIAILAILGAGPPAAAAPGPLRPPHAGQVRDADRDADRDRVRHSEGVAEEEAEERETYEQSYLAPRAWPRDAPNAAGLEAAIRHSRGMQGGLPFDPPAPPKPNGGGLPGDEDCIWLPRGPTNFPGRVTSIAIDPNNGDTVFAAGVGGLFRSLDHARHWERVSEGVSSKVYGAVAINPGDSHEVIVGGGDTNYHFAIFGGFGLWRSTEGGAPGSFKKLAGKFDDSVVYRVRIDPKPPHDVYVATSSSVYRGQHQGGDLVFSSLDLTSEAVDMAVDFSGASPIIYAAVRSGPKASGIWKYEDGTWTNVSSGLPAGELQVISLAMAPTSPKTLYATVAGFDGSLLGIYKTTDGAASKPAWTLVQAGADLDYGQSDYNNVIEVSPTNADEVWAGGLWPLHSTDGGKTWENVAGGDSNGDFILLMHPDQHAIAFDPSDPSRVYFGNDGGLDVKVPTGNGLWTWWEVDHGLGGVQFYTGAASRNGAQWTALGGTQDNGTQITYGSRSWYNLLGCDGADVALDAGNLSSIYAVCNGGLSEIADPIVPAGKYVKVAWTLPAGFTLKPPVVAVPGVPAAAYAIGSHEVAGATRYRVMATLDGVSWLAVSDDFEAGGRFTALAVAPSDPKILYALYTDANKVADPVVTPAVFRSGDGGKTWSKTDAVPGNLRPNAIAIDAADPKRVAVVFGGFDGGAIRYSVDGGGHWSDIVGAGESALPSTAAFTGAVFDPQHPQVLFVSAAVGVFRGQVQTKQGGGSAAGWTAFNEGLPAGLDVSAISVNSGYQRLSITSWGYGAFERNISGVACRSRQALVRDNVLDDGFEPSSFDQPDPTHPIPDPQRPGFFKPDDTPEGRVAWWTSPDIRIDVPSVDPIANSLPSVDHVEFEGCPIWQTSCPAQTILDSQPRRALPARVHVQVANQGWLPAHKLRVIVLWADATVGAPNLPADFWTKTFPASGACGALSAGSDWHVVDPANPCRTIEAIDPAFPEVVSLPWEVPPDAASHTCMLVIVESDEEPLAQARAQNQTDLFKLIPAHSQVALRNLHVVDVPAGGGSGFGAEAVNVPNPTQDGAPVELSLDGHGLLGGGRLIVVLPKGTPFDPGRVQRLRRVALPKTPEVRRLLASGMFDPDLAFEVDGAGGSLPLAIPPGRTWRIGLVYAAGRGRPGAAARFNLVARQRGLVLGGSSWILRLRR